MKRERRRRRAALDPTNQLDRLMLEFDLVDEQDDTPTEPHEDSLEAVMREFGEDPEPAPTPVRRRPVERSASQVESPPPPKRVKVTARSAPAKPAAKRKPATYIPLDNL